jgi:probable H4MPT-linked C1 transfer pathway protein
MGESVLGLDIGGANLKAAHTGGSAITLPFALWKQPDLLTSALAGLAKQLPPAEAVAAAMTGELCDCFATKLDGVAHIVQSLQAAFPDQRLLLWRTDGTFVGPAEAGKDMLALAASNWLALACLAGRAASRGAALLFDMGSTTTDLVPLVDGTPCPAGRTDLERLRSGELVYVGAGRTPLCALLPRPYAAEFFATTKDVYLELGMIPEDEQDRDTADGRPATRAFARSRLARMLCADPDQLREGELGQIARTADHALRQAVQLGLEKVTARLPAKATTIVVSGSGESLACDIVRRFLGKSITLLSLGNELGAQRSTAACAHAVALLAQEYLARRRSKGNS